jgi:hypothetical protein
MQGKITLITPPDFYENSNLSILLMHLTEEEQDKLSQWLAKSNISDNVNIYLYSGEPNITWFLYAMSRCEYKYINMDCVSFITQSLGGYILGKTNTYYKTSNDNLAAIYDHINSGRVDDVIKFFESIFGDQQTNDQ